MLPVKLGGIIRDRCTPRHVRHVQTETRRDRRINVQPHQVQVGTGQKLIPIQPPRTASKPASVTYPAAI